MWIELLAFGSVAWRDNEEQGVRRGQSFQCDGIGKYVALENTIVGIFCLYIQLHINSVSDKQFPTLQMRA